MTNNYRGVKMKKLANLSQPIMAIVATCLLVCITSVMIYVESGRKEHTLVIDLEDNADPFVTFPQLLPREDQITTIQEIDRSRNEYKIKVISKKQRSSLLSKLLGLDKVENARYD